MSDSEAVEYARRGTAELEAWLAANLVSRLDLSGADLQGCDLRWMNFAGADLSGVDFGHATLIGAYFGPRTFSFDAPHVTEKNVPVSLGDACFEGAHLMASTFNYVDLRGANFTKAYLGLANFRRAQFDNALFLESELAHTSFSGCSFV